MHSKTRWIVGLGGRTTHGRTAPISASVQSCARKSPSARSWTSSGRTRPKTTNLELAKPGFGWDLRKLTFNSHGRWLFGFSVKFTEGPDGLRVHTGGKIRGEFSLSRWFRWDKAPSK